MMQIYRFNPLRIQIDYNSLLILLPKGWEAFEFYVLGAGNELYFFVLYDRDLLK